MQVTSTSSKRRSIRWCHKDSWCIRTFRWLCCSFVIFADDENVTEEKENKQNGKENKTKHTPAAKNVSIKCRGKGAVHSLQFSTTFSLIFAADGCHDADDKAIVSRYISCTSTVNNDFRYQSSTQLHWCVSATSRGDYRYQQVTRWVRSTISKIIGEINVTRQWHQAYRQVAILVLIFYLYFFQGETTTKNLFYLLINQIVSFASLSFDRRGLIQEKSFEISFFEIETHYHHCLRQ